MFLLLYVLKVESLRWTGLHFIQKRKAVFVKLATARSFINTHTERIVSKHFEGV